MFIKSSNRFVILEKYSYIGLLGGWVEDIYVAKFNFNFDNTPNQGVQEYTTHNTTIMRQKTSAIPLQVGKAEKTQ